MKSLRLLLVAGLLAIAAAFALVQPALATAPTNFVWVHASALRDSGGTPVASATICFAPVNNSGTPISYQIGGGGQTVDLATCGAVTAGAFGFQLADTALTLPVHVCFNVTVTDNVSGRSLLGPGYDCVQPATQGPAVTGSTAWCTPVGGGGGQDCNFDNFPPNEGALVVEEPGQVGPQGPPGPVGNCNWVGNWAASHAYTANQCYAEGSNGYAVVIGYTSGSTFGSTDTANTVQIAVGLPLSGGTLTGPLYLSGAPTAPLQAADQAYVDAAMANDLPLAGGTITGPLVLPGNPTSALQAAPKQYVDSVASTASNALPLSGGTLTGPLVLPGNPASALQAAPKQYVDSQSALGTVITGASTGTSGGVAYLGLPGFLNLASSCNSALVPLAGEICVDGTDYNLLTVATEPSVATSEGRQVMITDGVTATDCTVGGGSYDVPCFSNGTNWMPIGHSISGNSGGGGGGSTQHVVAQDTLSTGGGGHFKVDVATCGGTGNPACPSGNVTIGGTTAAVTVQSDDPGGSGVPVSTTQQLGQTTYDSFCTGAPVNTSIMAAPCTAGSTEILSETLGSSSTQTNTLWPAYYTVSSLDSVLNEQREGYFEVPDISKLSALEFDTYQITSIASGYKEFMWGWQWRKSDTSFDYLGATTSMYGGGWGKTNAIYSIQSGHVYHFIFNVHRDALSSTACSGTPCQYWDKFFIQDVTPGGGDAGQSWNLLDETAGHTPKQPTMASTAKVGYAPNEFALQWQIDSTSATATPEVIIDSDSVIGSYTVAGSTGAGINENIGTLGEWDFDSTTLSADSGSSDGSTYSVGGGTQTYETSSYQTGTGAIDFGGTKGSYSVVTLPASEPSFYSRFYLNTPFVSTAGAGTASSIFKIYSGSTALWEIYLNDYADTVTAEDLIDTSQVCTVTGTALVPMTSNNWNLVEVYWSAGTSSSTGAFAVKWNGTVVSACNLTGINTGGTTYSGATSVQFGYITDSASTDTWDIEMDNVGFSNAWLGAATPQAGSGSSTASGGINNIAAQCTMASSTSCTVSYTGPYVATPFCFASPSGAAYSGGSASCSVSGTTVTIIAPTSNSLTWNALF